MNTFQIGVYVGLALAIAFLFSGLSILLFGKKIRNDKQKEQLEFNIGGQSMSMPYNVNLAICGIGALLLFLTFDLIKGSEDKVTKAEINTKFSFFSTAYASNTSSFSEVPGWIYFGYEKNPKLWKFDILNANYIDIFSENKEVILRSKEKVNIRKNHFGNFTGTILGFLSPPPKIIGKLKENKCVKVQEAKNIGFDKIWINTIPIDCPPI